MRSVAFGMHGGTGGRRPRALLPGSRLLVCKYKPTVGLSNQSCLWPLAVRDERPLACAAARRARTGGVNLVQRRLITDRRSVIMHRLPTGRNAGLQVDK